MKRVAIALFTAWSLLAPGFSASAANCENVRSGLNANPKPQNASRDIIGQDLDDIQQRGFMEIAAYSDFAPWSFEKDGKLSGIDIDLGKLIAKALGVEARFNILSADENVDADLRNMIVRGPVIGGKVSNVMMHVPYSFDFQCRNEAVVINGLYHQEQIAIAYRKEAYADGNLPVPAYFRFDPVGVENDSLADFYLTSVNNGMLSPMMTRYPSMEAAMEGMKHGDVKAVMGPLSQLEFFKDEAIGVHMPPLVGLSTGKWSIGLAVRFNWRPLSYAVDDAITAALEDGSIKAIFAKYGLTHTVPAAE